jgi:hypothetical protein
MMQVQLETFMDSASCRGRWKVAERTSLTRIGILAKRPGARPGSTKRNQDLKCPGHDVAASGDLLNGLGTFRFAEAKNANLQVKQNCARPCKCSKYQVSSSYDGLDQILQTMLWNIAGKTDGG